MIEKKNPIKESLEQIEPSDAVKERMLANIKQKAALQSKKEPEQTKKAKVLRFNTVIKWVLPIAACFVILIGGLIASPYLFHSLEKGFSSYDAYPMESEARDIEGNFSPVGAPEAAVSDAQSSASEVRDKTFTADDGHEYTLRSSTGDASSLGPNYDVQEKCEKIGDAELLVTKSGSDTYRQITWTKDNIHYIFSNADGASEEEFLKNYARVKATQQ